MMFPFFFFQSQSMYPPELVMVIVLSIKNRSVSHTTAILCRLSLYFLIDGFALGYISDLVKKKHSLLF